MALIEFDATKSARNPRERGIGFDRFADMDLETAFSIEDTRKDYGEQRLRVLGTIDGKLHAAVITPRGETIRVISLRRANTREERAYAKERQPS
ncbi:MAG: BrnT family toxin [Acidobacteria bacterium]|nr:BrnT family toxin [Acidobacteriota bacterium]